MELNLDWSRQREGHILDKAIHPPQSKMMEIRYCAPFNGALSDIGCRAKRARENAFVFESYTPKAYI